MMIVGPICDPLIAYKAVSDPDMLYYYHQAMNEKDRERFQESMLKEMTDQFDNGNFTVIHKSEVPKGQTIFPAVWQMRRKRDAKDGSIKKYKARLNIDGLHMKRGEHYNKTCSPVASWNSVRMLLTLTAVHGWHTKQIDFVQAFAQAPVEKTLYMSVPAGIELEDGSDPKECVLMIATFIDRSRQDKFGIDTWSGNLCRIWASSNRQSTNASSIRGAHFMCSTLMIACWRVQTKPRSTK
jgi:hypothetical protein